MCYATCLEHTSPTRRCGALDQGGKSFAPPQLCPCTARAQPYCMRHICQTAHARAQPYHVSPVGPMAITLASQPFLPALASSCHPTNLSPSHSRIRPLCGLAKHNGVCRTTPRATHTRSRHNRPSHGEPLQMCTAPKHCCPYHPPQIHHHSCGPHNEDLCCLAFTMMTTPCSHCFGSSASMVGADTIRSPSSTPPRCTAHTTIAAPSSSWFRAESGR